MVLSLPGAAHGAVTRPGERGGVLDDKLDVRAGFSGEVACASGFNALALASFSCSPRGLSGQSGMRVGGLAVGSEAGRHLQLLLQLLGRFLLRSQTCPGRRHAGRRRICQGAENENLSQRGGHVAGRGPAPCSSPNTIAGNAPLAKRLSAVRARLR